MISKDQIVSSSFVRYGALPLGLIALVVVLRIFFFTPFRVMTTAQAPALRLGAWAYGEIGHLYLSAESDGGPCGRPAWR